MATSMDGKKELRIPGMYTAKQAAEKLQMKPNTIRRYIARELINAGILAGVYLISEAELARFNANRRGPGNPNLLRKK